MTVKRFEHRRRALTFRRKSWTVRVHAMYPESEAAIACVAVRGEADVEPMESRFLKKARATLFTPATSARTVSLPHLKALAGSPSWGLFWKADPVRVVGDGVFDRVLIARALSCVRARGAVRVEAYEVESVPVLRIVGDAWFACIAARTNRNDRPRKLRMLAWPCASQDQEKKR